MPRETRQTRTTVNLPRRGLLGIDDGRGLRVEVGAGRVWLTQQGDTRDIVLGPGQCFVIDRAGRTLVQAFEAAELRLEGGTGTTPSTRMRTPFPRTTAQGVA